MNGAARRRHQFTLASGALLTLNANGTFNYNPNGAFNATPAPGSGAANQPAQRQLQLHITGGDTAMATITINGLDSNDVLRGAPGGRAMSGGIGNDVYVIGHAGDHAIEAVGEGHDIVIAQFNHALAPGSEIEILTAVNNSSATAIDLHGNALDNEVWGTNGVNYLSGGGGNDALIGFGGNDALAGLGGDDYLDGGTGADGMAGGSDNDVYIVDNVGDSVIESIGGGNDLVYTSVDYTLGAGSEVEILSATANAATTPLNLTGNAFDNRLWGTNGANVLNGAGGADIMIGFDGDDIYFVDNAGDVVIEGLDQGQDIVYASAGYTLAASVRVEILSAADHALSTALNLTGNEFSNEIWANQGANVLDGGAGADFLWGFGGADTFAFNTALGGGNVDWMMDFLSGTDTIALNQNVFAGLGAGPLSASAFHAGESATDAAHRIIYNQTTGSLLFDVDGAGGQAAVEFARVAPGLDIVFSDFAVI